MQGRLAGFISLLGVVLRFVVYMVSAAFGLTAQLVAVPFAHDAMVFASRPTWLKLQRWIMAGVLTGLAVRLVMDRRPA